MLVLGAQGVLGGSVARAFQDDGWRVYRGGRRTEEREDFRTVDLDREETVARAIADVDLVVNPVPHPGLVAERLVLARGGRLVNISALPYAAGRALRETTGDARGLVVMNGGRTPGVSNLLAAELLEAHPDADEVEIAFTLSTSGASGRAAGEFMQRNLTARPRHRTAVIPFPEPIGQRRCLEFAEPERGWLGGLAAQRAVRTYVCFVQRGLTMMLLGLNAVGVIARLPDSAFRGRGSNPEETSGDPVREWVALRRVGRRVAARTINGEGGYPMTASATLCLAKSLAEGSASRRGCFEPHEVVSLSELRNELAARGVEVRDVQFLATGQPSETA